MATIKAYTDLEQSRKLAEILPIESADMCWQQIYDENHMMSDYRVELIPYRLYSGIGVPCWSLASLLGVLSDYTLQTNTDGTVFVVCESKKPMISDAYNNPVDACVAMILKLNELKML